MQARPTTATQAPFQQAISNGLVLGQQVFPNGRASQNSGSLTLTQLESAQSCSPNSYLKHCWATTSAKPSESSSNNFELNKLYSVANISDRAYFVTRL